MSPALSASTKRRTTSAGSHGWSAACARACAGEHGPPPTPLRRPELAPPKPRHVASPKIYPDDSNSGHAPNDGGDFAVCARPRSGAAMTTTARHLDLVPGALEDVVRRGISTVRRRRSARPGRGTRRDASGGCLMSRKLASQVVTERSRTRMPERESGRSHSPDSCARWRSAARVRSARGRPGRTRPPG